MPENGYNRQYPVQGNTSSAQPRRSAPAGSASGSQPYRSASAGSASGSQPRRSVPAGSASGSQPYRSTSAGSASGSQPRRSAPAGSASGSQPYRSTSAGSASGSQPRRSAPAGSASGSQPYRSVPAGSTAGRTASAGRTSVPPPRPSSNDPRFRSAQPVRNASGAPQRRPQQPYQAGSAQRTSGGGYGGQSRIYQSGASAPRRTGTAAPKRPSAPKRSGGYGYSGPQQPQWKGWDAVPQDVKTIGGVLCAVLLIVLCVFIASRIRSSQPQPTISMNTPIPDSTMTMSAHETPAPTKAPENVPTLEPTVLPPDPTAVPNASNGSGRSVTIRAIGDVIIDTDTLKLCKVSKDTYDFTNLFSMAKDVMSDADWTMINIEATLRKHKEYGYMGFPQIRTPPSILDVLKDCGVDMLTMCNNHALDGYFDGLKDSLNFAEAAGLAHVGAYRTQEEFDTPEVYDLNGIKVGMLNYTQYTNGMASLSDKNATIYGMRLMAGADYAGDIVDLKRAGAEYVIAIMHWGKEYIRYPEAETVQTAKKLIAAGADLVIGGHPHVVQPAEYLTVTDANGVSRTGLVIYSIGNFLSEHRHENAAYTDNGVIFEFTLQENAYGQIELVNPACIPVYVWQIELGNEKYDYRVLPSGQYLNSPPAGMSASQYERMKQSWNEIVDLMNGVVPVIAQ